MQYTHSTRHVATTFFPPVKISVPSRSTRVSVVFFCSPLRPRPECKKNNKRKTKTEPFLSGDLPPEMVRFFFFYGKVLKAPQKKPPQKTAAKTCSHPLPVMAMWTRSEGQFAITVTREPFAVCSIHPAKDWPGDWPRDWPRGLAN
jgi:hypothetical protein